MLIKTRLALTISAGLLLTGCSKQPEQTQNTKVAAVEASTVQNPFFQQWNTPFGAPPFDQIETKHFLPAFEKAIAEHKKEIAAIVNNEQPADFDNTIASMELAGALLSRVSGVFFNLTSTESSDEMQALQRKVSPLLTRHYNEISMNENLYKRVSTVHNNRNSSDLRSEQIRADKLNAEQTRLVERIHRDFIHAGANLTPEQRTELATINERISALTTEFGQNALNDSRAFKLVLEESDLAGLSTAQRNAAAAAAKANDMPGKYVITLNRASVQPFLQFSERRDLREQAFNGWTKRGDNDNEFDNKSIIVEMVELRAKRAQLLGYKHHSEYVLSNAMAGKPETAMDLLLKVWEPAVVKAEQEREWIKEIMAKEGATHKLEPWDWRFYAEKVRKEKFNLDQGEIAEYFELENMLEAKFYVANRLFGLTFEERNDISVYNPVVRVWEVKDSAGKSVGLFFGDYYARSSKQSGAWMNSFREQQKLAGDVKPIIVNNMNLNKPAEGEATLMSYSDAVTLFHEFGHGLHGLLSNVTYPTLAGTSVPRDWVEFPAQLFEHFIAQPEMLKKFALHHKTNEPMPADLLARIKQASTFNQGFATVEFTASALVDMAYHQMTEVKDLDVREFENQVLSDYGKPEEIVMRHRSTHFGHIFAGGYSSAYYAYMWSEILDADGFDAFIEKKDIFDKETADRLYKFIYSRGDTLDYFEAYEGFRGRKPTTDALLRNRGLD
ncbi:M3 family metallopeptidase [Pseudoalteromonas aurantia]|uniref:Peptidase M3 n=1 Tax=Pseudoalteromonas aurantia TaxID=43654 RepID=A0ABY2VTI3_9GAMM|nr:M3 family metallopeptidase [Pseudoalteromonas aurantia]TMO59489.1 peptidase M3 [Pseudoalteromonas aurantia]TMO71282.1 peptidase M3 [Pseudoalteromonas aurantia]